MADTPNVQAPLWAASEASPWLMSAKRARIFDAFAAKTIVESRATAAPPGSCADGARYLVPGAGLSGAFAGNAGKLAIAVGANASNGWYFPTVAVEGVEIWVRDENTLIRHDGATWVTIGAGVFRLQSLLDVDTTGLADGYVLKWDASNGVFYPAPDQSGGAGTVTESIIVAASDESTALAAGTAKVTFRMPYAFTLTEVRASLTVAQTGGTTLKADLNEAGTSVLGANKLTFDNGQKSTGTAAQSGITITTVSSIADASIANNAEMTVDIDAIGDGTAKGLKVMLIGHQ